MFVLYIHCKIVYYTLLITYYILGKKTDIHAQGLNIKCNDWTSLLDEIVDMIIKFKKNTNIRQCITKIRNNFYILFITNIDFNYIIRNIMKKLLINDFPIKVKYNIINLTSIFQNRLSQGTRYIIHLEAYILKIIHLLQNIENIGIVKIEI